MDWIIAVAAIFHLFSSPYTKVEESFNIQACHDILYNGFYLSEYDHLEFPGTVPRTFIGPLFVSLISLPIVSVFSILGISKLYSQYVVRFVLGTLVWLAWRYFRKQLEWNFGKPLAMWFTFITASQFHFIYYLSRPLPNVFALIFALLAYSFWLQQRHKLLYISCGIGVFIFRSELCILLGPIIFYDLTRKKISIAQFLRLGIPIGIACLAATIFIDSIFWMRLVWPEGEVFWFNTYKNQSHHWGVYPFLWYWYSCLPRALGLSFLLVPVGISIDTRVRDLLAPGIIFLTLYSFLPHKELRFIIYVFPLLNIAAARACQFFWSSRMKSTTRKFLAIAAALHILANLVFTALLLTISSSNYPGGVAMHRFHNVVSHEKPVFLHIDNFAAQTGVTRFTQLNSHWRYNKSENLKPGSKEIRSFTHLLVEAKSKYAYNLKHYTTSHEILDSVEAFSHLSFNYFAFPPVKVRVKPAIFLLENTIKEDIDWSFLSSDKDSFESLTSSNDSFNQPTAEEEPTPETEVEIEPGEKENSKKSKKGSGEGKKKKKKQVAKENKTETKPKTSSKKKNKNSRESEEEKKSEEL